MYDGVDERDGGWDSMQAYVGFEPHLQVIAWVALTGVSMEAGRIEVIPGSYRLG